MNLQQDKPIGDTSYGKSQTTSEELECLHLIRQKAIPPRVFRMLQSIGLDRLRGVVSYGQHTIPAGISIRCPLCNVLNTMGFSPIAGNTDHLRFVGGIIQCSDCDQWSKMWLMEPEIENNAMRRWKEVWVSPPLKNEFSDLPLEVDEDFRRDFKEAALTLEISPRASVTLSRYCLQKLLHKQAGVDKNNLNKEIQEVIESGKLPDYLSRDIDAIRSIGSFSAHPIPIEDKNTGEIVEVDTDDATWILETLRNLFSFYFVEPAKSKAIKDEFNKKAGIINGKKQIK